MQPLPPKTTRDLAELLVYLADVARKQVARTVRRLHPYVAPPADLAVHSTRGAAYTGVLLIDDNDVLAGVVVCTGHSGPPPSTTRLPSAGSVPRNGSFHRQAHLTDWAMDPREEEDAWWPHTQR